MVPTVADKVSKVEEQAPINENDIDINELDDIENSDTEAAKNIAQEEEDEVESLRKQLADTQAQLEKEKKEYMFLIESARNRRLLATDRAWRFRLHFL